MRRLSGVVAVVAVLLSACGSGGGPSSFEGSGESGAEVSGDDELVSSGGSSGDGGPSTIAVVPAAGNTIDGRLDLGAVRSVEVGGSPTRVEAIATPDGVQLTVTGADVRTWTLVDDELVEAEGGFVPAFRGQASVDDALADGIVVPFPDNVAVDDPDVDDADDRFVVLADPTEEYGHAVLGDGVEARAVVVVPRVGDELVRLEAEAGRVIEQRRVLVTMLDGEEAVVVTTSSPADGARVEVWSLESDRQVIGPAIGTGNRWRHVIGVSKLPDGGLEIAEVITPHLAKIASFLQVEGDRLVQVDRAPDAIASHQLGSPVLDRAALVDVDGDGRRDLVGPAADGDGLAWVIAGDDAPNQMLAGRAIATNLALATRPDGTVILAHATTTGTLIVHG